MSRLTRTAMVDKAKILADATLAQIMDDGVYAHDDIEALLDMTSHALSTGVVNGENVEKMRQAAEAVRDAMYLVLQGLDELDKLKTKE